MTSLGLYRLHVVWRAGPSIATSVQRGIDYSINPLDIDRYGFDFHLPHPRLQVAYRSTWSALGEYSPRPIETIQMDVWVRYFSAFHTKAVAQIL